MVAAAVVTKINWHHVLFKWHLRETCGLCATQPPMYAAAPKLARLKRCVQGLFAMHNRIKCKCVVEFGGTGAERKQT